MEEGEKCASGTCTGMACLYMKHNEYGPCIQGKCFAFSPDQMQGFFPERGQEFMKRKKKD